MDGLLFGGPHNREPLLSGANAQHNIGAVTVELELEDRSMQVVVSPVLVCGDLADSGPAAWRRRQ